jgi:hypothetical protein
MPSGMVRCAGSRVTRVRKKEGNEKFSILSSLIGGFSSCASSPMRSRWP